MTLLSKLLGRFHESGYRHAYVDSFLDSYIATQIKVLREQRDLTQTGLADLAGMKQSQISRLEDVNHSSWKISTLKKLARAFDLVLVVRFESFGHVMPDIDGFGREKLERQSFADDPVFADPDQVHQSHAVETHATQILTAGSTARVLPFRDRSVHRDIDAGSTTSNFINQAATG